jgi:hypothetical protein
VTVVSFVGQRSRHSPYGYHGYRYSTLGLPLIDCCCAPPGNHCGIIVSAPRLCLLLVVGGDLMRRIGLSACPYCGEAGELYTSSPKTWRDEACCFFFLQVVRCHSCMRRHYRPLFMPPVPVSSEKKPVQTGAAEAKRKRPA